MSKDAFEQVLSSHRTTQGVVSYVRRPDGGLQVWAQDAGSSAPGLVTESHRAADHEQHSPQPGTPSTATRPRRSRGSNRRPWWRSAA